MTKIPFGFWVLLVLLVVAGTIGGEVVANKVLKI